MKRWLYQKLTKNLKNPDLIAPLFWGAGIALGLKISGIFTSYSLQVLLARWMGPTEYGTYDFIITGCTLLGYLAGLGLSNSLLRFIPEYSVKKDWGHLRGVVLGSWRYVLFAGILIASVGTTISFWVGNESRFSLNALLLGAWTVPLLALSKHQLEMARAMGRITLAYLPSLVVWPFLVVISTFCLQQTRLSTVTHLPVMGITLLSLLIVLIAQLWLFQRNLPNEWFFTHPIYALREWFSVSFPLLLIDSSVIFLSQSDILMIGALLSSFEVGIYSAAVKTANWVNFILMAMNAVAAPMFATLYAQGNREGLQKVVSTVSHWMFWPSLIIALVLIGFANSTLSLFGSEFSAAQWAMIILVLGELVNVGAGSVGYLMQVTGYHNQCAYVFGFSALINLSLNAMLIPKIGITGAAIATAFTRVLWSIWLHQLIVKNVGIHSSIISALRLSKT